MITQLKELAALKEQGILTDAEFDGPEGEDPGLTSLMPGMPACC